MIINHTPVERHHLNGVPILVKREDLCSPLPGPSFSFVRGVVAHMKARQGQTIGVLDTYHSKAGWAVAYVGNRLGNPVVDFWPRFKRDNYTGGTPPRLQQQYASQLGATLVDLQAGRSAVLYHQAKKELAKLDPGAYMMPNALKLPESITENAAEAIRTAELGVLPSSGTLVISISSGTVAAGVLRGFEDAGLLGNYDVVLHMGYSRSQQATREYIEKVSGLRLHSRVHFVDEGYGYADEARGVSVPFPCNPFYDAKAWKWLQTGGAEALSGKPIVFWNIGE